jgi:hypothetical protein
MLGLNERKCILRLSRRYDSMRFSDQDFGLKS